MLFMFLDICLNGFQRLKYASCSAFEICELCTAK
jgi:hypothetical protein